MAEVDDSFSTLQGLLGANLANLTLVNFENATVPDFTALCSESFSMDADPRHWDFFTFTGYNTFNVCTTYPNLTQSIAQDLLDDQQRANLSTYNIDGDAIGLDLSVNLTLQIPRYLHELCKEIQCDKTTSFCSLQNMLLDDNTTLSAAGLNACQGQVCAKTLQFYTDNPDIGGIGVSISYMMQMLMVILILLYIAFNFLHSLYHRKPLRTHEAFVGMCVSFQRTQSWFITAMIIAAFYSNYKGNVSTVDGLLLAVLALHGAVLLSFTQSTLLYLGHHSWYTTVLALISYILCSTFFGLYMISPDFLLDTENVTAFCWSQLDSFKNINEDDMFFDGVSRAGSNMMLTAYGFCSIVMFCTIIWQAYDGFAKLLPGLTAVLSRWRRRLLPTPLIVFLVGGAYSPALILQIYLLRQLMAIVDPHDWPFGQVVAAFVFMPVYSDYLHDRYMKVERALANRKSVLNGPHSRTHSEISLPLREPSHKNSTHRYTSTEVEP